MCTSQHHHHTYHLRHHHHRSYLFTPAQGDPRHHDRHHHHLLYHHYRGYLFTPAQGDQDRGAEESEVVGGGDGACQPDGQTQRETGSIATGLIAILYFGFADLFYKLLTYCSARNMNSGQVTDKLQALNDEFAAMTKKKKDLEDNIDLCSQKLDRS